MPSETRRIGLPPARASLPSSFRTVGKRRKRPFSHSNATDFSRRFVSNTFLMWICPPLVCPIWPSFTWIASSTHSTCPYFSSNPPKGNMGTGDRFILKSFPPRFPRKATNQNVCWNGFLLGRFIVVSRKCLLSPKRLWMTYRPLPGLSARWGERQRDVVWISNVWPSVRLSVAPVTRSRVCVHWYLFVSISRCSTKLVYFIFFFIYILYPSVWQWERDRIFLAVFIS